MITLRQMLRGSYPADIPREERVLTLVMEVMLDDAGTGNDSAVVACAGYIANFCAWNAFEVKWRQLLRSYGIRPEKFSMKDYAHSTGDFKNWKGDKGKRQRFIQRALSTIRDHVEHGFVAVVKKSDYQDAVSLEVKERFGGSFACCAQQVVGMAETYLVARCNERGSNYRRLEARYIFEKGTYKIGSLLDVIRECAAELLGDGIRRRDYYQKDKSLLPLHTADVMAYETCKFFNDVESGEKRLRKTYETLLVGGIPHWMIGLDRAELAKADKDLRANHAAWMAG